MATTTVTTLARVTAMSAMASKMPGMAIKPSMKRINTESTRRK